MLLLLYFILRSVAAYRTVIVAMRCVIVSINHYLSIHLKADKQTIYGSSRCLSVHSTRVHTIHIQSSAASKKTSKCYNDWHQLATVDT